MKQTLATIIKEDGKIMIEIPNEDTYEDMEFYGFLKIFISQLESRLEDLVLRK